MTWETHWFAIINLGILAFVNIFSLSFLFFFYHFVYKKTERSKEVANRNPTVITNQFSREFWFWFTDPLLRLLLNLGFRPNTVSRASCFFSFIAGIAFLLGHFGLAGWIMILGGTLDTMDGRIARMKHIDSPAGAFLDSVLDRYSDFFAFSGIIIYMSYLAIQKANPYLNYMVYLSLLSILGSILISYSKERGAGLGVLETSGLMQRADRVFVLGLFAVFDPILNVLIKLNISDKYYDYHFTMGFGLLLIALLGNNTAIRRILKIYGRLKAEGLESRRKK